MRMLAAIVLFMKNNHAGLPGKAEFRFEHIGGTLILFRRHGIASLRVDLRVIEIFFAVYAVGEDFPIAERFREGLMRGIVFDDLDALVAVQL